jgi:DedD protein
MASSARRRGGGGPGGAQWIALGGAVLVILGLTFALGLLVGRQWARHAATTAVAGVSEPAKKAGAPARRSGIAAETMADRAPESTEKLTFYKTLTEPLDGPGAAPKPEAKPVAIKIPPATPSTLPPSAPAPAPPAPAANKPAPVPAAAPPVSLPPLPGKSTDGGSAGAISGTPHTNNASASAPVGAAASASGAQGPTTPYTVQVGAYKNRRQADDSRQQLASAGLDAYVVTLAAQEGVARYRVRVGTYRSREEAAAAAERLRTQRSLTTFVTTK